MSHWLRVLTFRVLLAVAAALATSLAVLALVWEAGVGESPCGPDPTGRASLLGTWLQWLGALADVGEPALAWSCQPLAPLGLAAMKTSALVLVALTLALGGAALWAWVDWRGGAPLRPLLWWPAEAVLRSPPVLWATGVVAGFNLLLLAAAALWPIDLRSWLLPGSAPAVKLLASGAVLVLGGGLILELRQEVGRQVDQWIHQDVFLVAQANGLPIAGLLVRNLIVGVLAAALARLPVLLGEVVIVEHVFVLDGLGRALVEIVHRRDGAAMMFIAAILVLLTSLLRAGLEGLREGLTPSLKEVST